MTLVGDSPRKITAEDLIEALEAADALETFCRLPDEDQEKFIRWIGMARDNDAHWRRVEALVLALRIGPLNPIGQDSNQPGEGESLGEAAGEVG